MRPWRLLAPALLLLGTLVLGALAVSVLRATGLWPFRGVEGAGLQVVFDVLGDRNVWASAALSLWIAGMSTALSVVVAVPAAMWLRARRSGAAVVRVLFQLNLTVPHLVGALGILYLFGQSGAIARLAHAAGLIGAPVEFPALIYDPAAIGIILTYVWKEVPFIGLIVLAQLQAIGRDYEAVAATLGASSWQRLRHVILPQIAPGLLAAAALVFAFTFGAFEVPLLLGQSDPQALPVLAYRAFTDVDLAARPQAMALSVLVAVLSGAAMWVYLSATARLRR